MLHKFTDLPDDTAYPGIWDFLPILQGDFIDGGSARILEAITAGFLQVLILGATTVSNMTAWL
jgi:hypothetical protein